MFVTSNELADTSDQSSVDNRILRTGKNEFKKNFNVNSFRFEHTLHQNRLFEIPRIVELARRMSKSCANGDFEAFDLKHGNIDTKFSALPQSERLAETVARIGETGTWIKLRRTQDYDAEYAQVLDAITSELENLCDLPLRRDITWVTMTLFLASPKVATPFHIDHETNFLFQIQGSKDVCLFPAADRELLPDREIERYYSGNFEAALYRGEMQDRGTVYRLTPGQVLHHPPLAPHWVRNGDNISVSIAISYCMKPLEARARVYQANYILRTMGLKPSPPGLSPWRDSLKRKVIASLEHSDPKTFSEVVFTPMNRLKSQLNSVRRLLKA